VFLLLLIPSGSPPRTTEHGLPTMRDSLKPILAATLTLARRLEGKKIPTSLTGDQWTGTTFTDIYQRQRNPTPNELLAELKGVASPCISLNASVCPTPPPRLYVATHSGQKPAKCLTKTLHPAGEARLRARKDLPPALTKAARIEEVLDHPLLTLLRQVNPIHN